MPIPAITPAGRGIVGRTREMEALQLALAKAKDGRAQVAMLAGEPGIGKTHTAQEPASHQVLIHRFLASLRHIGRAIPLQPPIIISTSPTTTMSPSGLSTTSKQPHAPTGGPLYFRASRL